MIHDEQHLDQHLGHCDHRDHLDRRDDDDHLHRLDASDGAARKTARDQSCRWELSRMLETLRAGTVDTGHAATQHAVDAALVALEETLDRLSGFEARNVAPGGAA